MIKKTINNISLVLLVLFIGGIVNFLVLYVFKYIIYSNYISSGNIRYLLWQIRENLLTPYNITYKQDHCGLLGCYYDIYGTEYEYLAILGVLFSFIVINWIVQEKIILKIGIVLLALSLVAYIIFIWKFQIIENQNKCINKLYTNEPIYNKEVENSKDHLVIMDHFISNTGFLMPDPRSEFPKNIKSIIATYGLKIQEDRGLIAVPKGKEFEIYCKIIPGVVTPLTYWDTHYWDLH